MKFRNDTVATQIVDVLRTHLNVLENGAVSYDGGAAILFDALYVNLKHTYQIEDEVVFDALVNSVLELFKRDGIRRVQDITVTLGGKCARLLRVREEYVLVTSVNLPALQTLKRRNINGSTISFSPVVPVKYNAQRKKIIEQHQRLKFGSEVDFTFVTVKINAPDKKTAYNMGMDVLNVYRALFQLNTSRSRNLFSQYEEQRHPTASILQLGPLHTLHKPSGEVVNDGLWYEPQYRQPALLNILNPELAEHTVDILLKQLRLCPFSVRITEILKLFISATDSYDPAQRFMMLWATMERATGTDDTDLLLKRACFFFEDRELQKNILESLRLARHSNVHGGKKPFHIGLKNQSLLSFVTHIILFLLQNPFKHRDWDSFLQFITTNVTSVDKEIKKLQMVKKFIKG
ncbi:hypothetical protein [Pseudomonas sp. TMW 2.1634]|uniref:hypothetical protein n=1 Tax=Pseudomonas sp. TMW 2.1634 TaxID=1886807 RepID=UPI000E720E38|nr:hypothetical protein [Pseudomonas sp. TMW 2.1634]AOA08391.1 hypothetical protein BFC21_22455 [Pseudomonas sp. TMW 2.1634]